MSLSHTLTTPNYGDLYLEGCGDVYRRTWTLHAIIWGWQGSMWPVSCLAAAATTATAVQAARPAVKREARLLVPLPPRLRRRPMHGPHITSDGIDDVAVVWGA